MQICGKHGLTEFTNGGGKRPRCRKCMVIAVDKRRRKLKQMALDYKGGKCQACGYNRYVGALEFHHLDPTQKDFGISGGRQTAAWEKIKVELNKCILLCSNCHREMHAGIIHP